VNKYTFTLASVAVSCLLILCTGCANPTNTKAGTSTSVSAVAGELANQSNVNLISGQDVQSIKAVDKTWVQNPLNYDVSQKVVMNLSVSVPILEYHEANFVPGDIATLKPGQLQQEIEWLHAHGFHTINFGQLYAAMYHGYTLPSQPILLTFDDGYESVYFKVFPLLKKYHYQATLFIIAGFTHDQPNRHKQFPALTVSELQEMQESGLVDIEDHTMYHRNLASLGTVDAKYEIVGSMRILQNIVHHPMVIFCYPDGGYTSETISLVKNAGYLLAVSQTGGYANLNNGPYTLDRISVLDFTTLNDFSGRLKSSLR